MTGLPSIRQRLSTTLVAVSIAWGIAVSGVVWLVVRHEVDELLDGALQESAEILFGLLSFNAAQLPLQGGEPLPAPLHDEHLVWQIVGPDHRVLLRSHRAPDRPLAPLRSRGLSSAGEEWRVFGLPFDETGRFLYVAQHGSDRGEARLEAAEVTAGSALVVGLLCALWLRSRVRRELEPIVAMSAAVSHFDPLRPGAHLPESARAELVPMRDAITDLGARLAKRLASERAFSAHAAHALRTPLAGMVAQLAVAQRKSPAEAQPHLQRTRDAAERLRRVVTALLTLFRTGGEVAWRPADIAEVLAHLPFDALTLTTEGSTRLLADTDLLAAALMNLLDNSLRCGATAVVLAISSDSAGTHVIVRDNGPGMKSEERRHLQSALDQQSYEGSMGLGLMLADLVARAHGGRLVLLDDARGFGVDICLGPPPPNSTGAIEAASR